MARVFITGSSDGLGRAAAETLIAAGHEVVVHVRSAERAAAIPDLTARALGVAIGDLASARATRGVAEQVNALGRMNAVIHNAGVYRLPDRAPTGEGHPTTLAINTLAPFILAALITRPDRLIFLSSGLHRGGEGSLQDMNWRKRRWDPARAYAETKLQVAALASALARRWPDVISSAVDPGWVRTRMGGPSAPVDLATGQRTQAWLAVSDEPRAKASGGYWRDMRQEAPAGEVTDPDFQDELITECQQLTGVWLP